MPDLYEATHEWTKPPIITAGLFNVRDDVVFIGAVPPHLRGGDGGDTVLKPQDMRLWWTRLEEIRHGETVV